MIAVYLFRDADTNRLLRAIENGVDEVENLSVSFGYSQEANIIRRISEFLGRIVA